MEFPNRQPFNFDFTSLYPNTMKMVVPLELKRTTKIKKILNRINDKTGTN